MIGRDYYFYAVFNLVDLNYLADLNDVRTKNQLETHHMYIMFLIIIMLL